MSRFDLFRALPDDSRAAWLGYVVARSLEASLNMSGERQLPFQDHLGSLIGIDVAQWWRPTASNYFDRVSKQVILDALTDVGGLELSPSHTRVGVQVKVCPAAITVAAIRLSTSMHS